MSEFTEAIYEALTDEWQSTHDIGTKVCSGLDWPSHRCKVQHHLRVLVANRRAEERQAESGGIRYLEWRRIA